MKNKSGKHKESNTFKFQPFSERIANIDINIFHHVAHEYESQVDDEEECFFYQTIIKWDVLNLTEGYQTFRKEIIAGNVITLPQLIHNKEHVVKTLLKHLETKNPLFLQPLLELTVALAKDLTKEFYTYYPQFFELIIDLLNTKDADQLEWTFTCLAYLFKFLWRPLTKDIQIVFKKLLPLLSHLKPNYINNFAAESFAFVVRKVKDKESFLSLLVNEIAEKDDEIEGCAKLLFEVIKGVNGHFHSCAQELLPFFLESLGNANLPKNTMFQILERIVANIVIHISINQSDVFWSACVNTLGKFCELWKSTNSNQNLDCVEQIMKLIGQAVEYKEGKFLQNTNLIVNQLLNHFQLIKESQCVLLTFTQLCIAILISKNIKLTQEQCSALTRRLSGIQDEKIYFYFVENSVDCPLFEALILPAFLQHCAECNLNVETLHVLTRIILKKSSICACGTDISNWNRYPLDFGSANTQIVNILIEYISNGTFSNSLEDLNSYFDALTCVPHLEFAEKDQLKLKVTEKISSICEALAHAQQIADHTNCKQLLYVLLRTIECSVHVFETLPKDYWEKITGCILPICTDVSFLCALRIMDLCLTACNDNNILCIDVLNDLHKTLVVNFNSPFHQMRLLTAHIYSLFEGIDGLDPDWRIFSLCYEIESIPAQVHTYRDQLIRLEKFNFNKPEMELCKNSNFDTIPLRYLCGILFTNFKLLWDNVIPIIASQASGLPIEVFWPFFIDELKKATNTIRGCKTKSRDLESKMEHFLEMYQIDCKPDFFNYRLLLWKSLENFTDLAEMKNRDLSEMFLDFIDKEYSKSTMDGPKTCNIKQHNIQFIETNEVNDDEKTNDEQITKVTNSVGGKANLEFLMQQLTVFSKMKSPLSVYRQTELYNLYMKFLLHRHSNVQKLALNCILTYKQQHILPYKDNLFNLIDEKNFKNELTAFRIDQESNIQMEREILLPIVLRLAFSKMSAKTGMRTRGKSTGQFRRKLVLRFVAGCSETELLNFIDLAFGFYKKYLELNDNPQVLSETIVSSIDFEKFPTLKRFSSTLNLLMCFKKLIGLAGHKILSHFIKIIIVIGTHVKEALTKADQVHVGYLNALKNQRNSTITLLQYFFTTFDTYPWSSEEINVIFNLFVWPYLDKLPIEGIHSPTALLKLFVTWGSNPRYFPLLMKCNESDYIMPKVVQLMLQKQTNRTVYDSIMEMFENLLKLNENPEEENLKLNVDNLQSIDETTLEKLHVNDKLNYGSCILLPFVPNILDKLRLKLANKKKTLDQRESFVLSRISELVWESTISDSVLEILIPVVLKKCTVGEEILSRYITTITNLLKNVNKPQKHLQLLLPLFGNVTHVACRKQLIEILNVMADRDKSNSNIALMARLINDLNAFDAKWVDQPNFEKRLDAFREINRLIQDEGIDLNLGVAIIYNCNFTICNENDLSLRETASQGWKLVSSFLLSKYSNKPDQDYILNHTLLALIRKGMRSKKENFRTECLLLLGHLARKHPTNHIVLTDLNKFTNEIDLEVDFFENITHLQLHRHTRAILKLSNILNDQSASTRSLTQFILPIISNYICNEKYATKNTLIDSVISAFSAICKLLPWHQYEELLKYYLAALRHKIDYQKQLVRLVVAILDSFHFNLSKVELNEEDKAENKEVEETEGKEVTVEEEQHEEADLFEKDDENTDSNVKEPDSTLLSKSTAKKVVRTIQIVLLPQLNRHLAEFTQYEESHKLNKKKIGLERIEDDLLRVPISLAMVKLLQQLPKHLLNMHLPKILLKLCTFLKSQLESVRRTARDTLKKIMTCLGAEYLPMLLDTMSSLLSKGYQVHVLVYTTHAILTSLKDTFQEGDADKVLSTILNLCKVDLFGYLGEEKEVVKISRKVSEAKATKSYDTLRLLAQFMTQKCLVDLIEPIKDALIASRTQKIVVKVEQALRNIAIGIVENNFLTVEAILKFAYLICSERVSELLPNKTKEKHVTNGKTKKADCFIIQPPPVTKSGFRHSKVKVSSNTNNHLLVEFGLQLCHHLFKKDKLKEASFIPYVDPFVGVLSNCLTTKHVKLTTSSLNCLRWLVTFNLPSLPLFNQAISSSIFNILHKYAAAGLSKGDNFDLVVAAFKTMTVLVRDVKCFKISCEKLKLLLLYIEQDLHDYNKQATAFNLLKAIIGSKLRVQEIHPIMIKVAEMSITSELPHIRLQCRLVFYQFLMDYPLGKRLPKLISFYLSQLNYELQTGRESAIEMIQSLINGFPLDVLKDQSDLFLVTLGARLINEDIPTCRKAVAKCLTSMFTLLPKQDRNSLFDIIILWLQDNSLNHRRVGAQLCGLLVSVETNSFESRLNQVIPLILSQFIRTDGRYVLVKANEVEETDGSAERLEDYHTFQLVQLLIKLCRYCPAFLKRIDDVDTLANHVQILLAHPHDWVRLAAVQFLGFVLSSLDVEHLVELIVNNKSEEKGYLYTDTINQIKSLTLDLCAQLQSGIKTDFAEQIIKNLLFIARVLQAIPIEGNNKINLLWLAKTMRKIINMEVVENPTEITLRTEIFKWIGAVATSLEISSINSILPHLLGPLIREMVSEEVANAPLRQLAKEVGNMLKNRVGVDAYTRCLSKQQQNLEVRRAERKRERSELAVSDPELYAKKKMRLHEKKKIAKKRKLNERKEGKSFKKRKGGDAREMFEN